MPLDSVPLLAQQVSNKEIIRLVLKLVLLKILTTILNLEILSLDTVNRHALEDQPTLLIIKQIDNVYKHVQPLQCKLMVSTENVSLTVHHQHGQILSM